MIFFFLKKKILIVGDETLLNTKFELSMPGFLNIDYVNQIRREEKIGGGGSATIYKGAILDQKLKEVHSSFFIFFFFQKKEERKNK